MTGKHDTSSLEEQSDSIHRTAATEALHDNAPPTTPFPPPSVTEAQTHKLDESLDYADGIVQPAGSRSPEYRPPTAIDNPTVKGIGIKERTAVASSYFPGIGFAMGFLVLFLAPSSENKARFHAAQSVAAHAFIGIVIFFLNTIGAGGAAGIFGGVTSIVMLVFTFKAWKGKPVYIESVSRATEWLEEKTTPRK